ncbi:MAG: HAMP domain-containing sensor histidine kinase [Pseudomonadota bacterium]
MDTTRDMFDTLDKKTLKQWVTLSESLGKPAVITHQDARIIHANTPFTHFMQQQEDSPLESLADVVCEPFGELQSLIKKCNRNWPATHSFTLKSNRGQEVLCAAKLFHIDMLAEQDQYLFWVMTQQTKMADFYKQISHQHKRCYLGNVALEVAHDINNVLSIIGGYIDLLDIDKNDEKGIKNLACIQAAVQHGSELSERILTFANDDTPQQKIITSEEVLNASLPLLKSCHLGKTTLTVSNKLTSKLVVFPGDLEQIIINLGVNAIRALQGIEGTVHIEFAPADSIPDNDFSVFFPHSRWLKLQISDDGAGMTEQDLEKIFLPYYTQCVDKGGHGLGLTIVRDIVERYGGSIDVQSKINHGTCFTIFLPILGHEEG